MTLNLQLLCQPCNNQKHVKHPVDFMREKGFLL
jgi:5-methylcytosine-specific restriction endonuclease McrA